MAQSANELGITDLMLKQVLDELFQELDSDGSGTLEIDELAAYSKNMQQKIKPGAEFNEHYFNNNFYRMDTYASGWVNRDTLFKFVLQKAIASGTIQMKDVSEDNAAVPKDFVDY